MEENKPASLILHFWESEGGSKVMGGALVSITLNRTETWGLLVVGRHFKKLLGLKTFDYFVISLVALTQTQGKK